MRDLQDKNSPQFHKFLSADQWNYRYAPLPADEQAVVLWAEANGLTVTRRYANRLIVDLEGNTVAIENAFQVKINNYQDGSSSFFSNDREPSVPASIGSIVHSVGGLNNLQVLQPAINGRTTQSLPVYSPGPVSVTNDTASANGDAAARKRAPRFTNAYYDPTDIYSSTAYDFDALYNLGHCCNPLNNPGSSPPDTSIAIATAGDFALSDLQGFQAQYPYLAYSVQTTYVDGTSSCCNDETTLDVEWSTAMSNSFGSHENTSTVSVYEGANANLSTFTDIYNVILDQNVTRVFTTSWGCAEQICSSTATMDTDHAIFNQMGGMGWTMIAAAGDKGATADCAHVSVSYPASDPNVLAAGGTYLSTGAVFENELAWTGGTSPGSCSANDGGGGGGVSSYFSAPSYQSLLGQQTRAVPDLSLNASYGQNYYFNGTLSGSGGTSIVAPELAGFFAQENSYLLYLSGIVGNTCSGTGSSPCSPMGWAPYFLYFFGQNPYGASHYPFYDVTSGCNSNDITLAYNLTYYCASQGYDLATGWGSANMLQLAWAINTYLAGDFGSPQITFSGPPTSTWYSADQLITWSISDTETNGHPPNGVAGFSEAWDQPIVDVEFEATPGSGNSFYDGPQFPNTTTGSVYLSSAGQGCHSINVKAWDNAGVPSGSSFYGPLCYDTTPPTTVASLSGPQNQSGYISNVQVALLASDIGSGVASTTYTENGGTPTTYLGPFVASAVGTNVIKFYSTDIAGNVESVQSTSFVINSEGYGPCTFTLSPPSGFTDSRAQTESVVVTASNNGCAWGAATNSGFVTVSGAGSGKGSGTVVLSVGANSSGADLTGSVTIAGSVLPFTQRFTTTIFSDVQPSYYDFDGVNLLSTENITSGCSATPFDYCPTEDIIRSEMAIFIVRAALHTDNFAYSATPYFSDVPAGSFGFQWIQKMFELGITSGCATNLFCPDDEVTRAQMAVFLIRMRYGSSYVFDYPSAPYFTDVPAGSFAFNYIQRMKEDNITSGCGVTTYCPTDPVTRGDMATFVMRGGFNALLPAGEPILGSISPNTIIHGASPATYTISGLNTDFTSGVTVLGAMQGITVGSVSVVNTTTLTVQLSASSGAALGPVSQVTITPVGNFPPQNPPGTEAVLPNGLTIE